MSSTNHSKPACVYFHEPVDQFAAVQHAWQSTLENRAQHVIFYRSKPGQWQSRGYAWSIKYILSGNSAFTIDGHECDASVGTCFIIPAGMEYCSSIADACTLSVFGMPPQQANRDFTAGMRAPYGIFHLNKCELKTVRDIHQKLQSLHFSQANLDELGTGSRLALPSAFPLPQQFLDLCTRMEQLMHSRNPMQQRVIARLLKARHYIASQFAQEQICQRAAEFATMTRSHFSRQFSALIGRSPMQFVSDHRKVVAQNLLREGRMSVDKIAHKLGYQFSSSLSHLFQRGNLAPPRQVSKSLD